MTLFRSGGWWNMIKFREKIVPAIVSLNLITVNAFHNGLPCRHQQPANRWVFSCHGLSRSEIGNIRFWGILETFGLRQPSKKNKKSWEWPLRSISNPNGFRSHCFCFCFFSKYFPGQMKGCSLKKDDFKRTWIIFQPSIFRGCVGFQGGN